MCNTFTSFYSQSIFGLNPESGDLKFHAVGTRSGIQKRPHVQFLVGRGGSKVAIICKGEAELRCVLCANGSWKAEPVRLVMRGPRSPSLAKGPYYVSSLSHTHTYTRLHQQFTFVPAWIKRKTRVPPRPSRADSHTCAYVGQTARRKLVCSWAAGIEGVEQVVLLVFSLSTSSSSFSFSSVLGRFSFLVPPKRGGKREVELNRDNRRRSAEFHHVFDLSLFSPRRS